MYLKIDGTRVETNPKRDIKNIKVSNSDSWMIFIVWLPTSVYFKTYVY